MLDDIKVGDKLKLLINFLSPQIYATVSDCSTYEETLQVLKSLYVKPSNTIFARHLLSTWSQQSVESVKQYVQALRQLSKDCNFKNVTAEEQCSEYIRDAFITGLNNAIIRQRLLENNDLTLLQAIAQAEALENAVKNC